MAKVRHQGSQATPLQSELARQILARIEKDDLQAGAPVRELALAQAFGVSRTPVRAALGVLEGLGYVRRTPGRGFVLAKKLNGAGRASARLPRSPFDELLTALMTDRARNRIPAEVSEAELMPRYGVSRGALRRVLMKLADDGLVRRQRGHGWRFVEALDSREAVTESYRFRMIVECAALREPGFTPDPAELHRLREAHLERLREGSDTDPRRWFETNRQFHETLTVWSGNRYLVEAVRRQNALRQLGEYSTFPRLSPERIAQSTREHIGILDALIAGDRDWAATLLHRHLDLTVRIYGGAGGGPTPPPQAVGSTGVKTPARRSIASAASRQRSSR
ncbi:GntR family transcriptional regulator [Vineibacter terrae]|uniref:GntR family transcriptional regulator n=1 Tax=Vineibacter terrae TaxID=2586908 RepID=A0A5C8PUJ8_9HYPH|nr:GntR family transcriptional regulator [Vineibacter terrae]TXL81579.1 GntR family transcriptional regulator [Vineibacter terrae]